MPVDTAPEPEQQADGKAVAMLDVLIDQLKGRGRPAHQVWLPPLADPPGLGELLGPLAVDPSYGLCTASWPGRGQLTVPVGVVDRPYEQRRDPMMVELAGAGGNVVIVGRSLSGKSTMLRTLLASLALTHTPREVQFFCLDFGGGALRSLERLPHLAGVAGRRDVEAVRRTVAEVVAVLDDREGRFAQHGIDSVASYRRRRAAGEFADDPFGDVFLVVDGWNTLRQEYEELEQTITTLANRGLGFGVHVVLTAVRWAEIRINMRDLLGTKLELRLGDASESEIDRRGREQRAGEVTRSGPDPRQAALPHRDLPDRRSAGHRRSERGLVVPGRARGGELAGSSGAEGAAAAPTAAGGGAGPDHRPVGTRAPDRCQRVGTSRRSTWTWPTSRT